MERDDHGSVTRTQLHVTAALADLFEAEPGKRLDGLPA